MEPITMTRDTVFISHATPDDNDFVRWLGTRLTGHGYKVWADLFELKGGDPFWSTIEEALRHHACKMIFVVSKASVDPSPFEACQLKIRLTLSGRQHRPDIELPVEQPLRMEYVDCSAKSFEIMPDQQAVGLDPRLIEPVGRAAIIDNRVQQGLLAELKDQIKALLIDAGPE
jgi:hypothetical protein